MRLLHLYAAAVRSFFCIAAIDQIVDRNAPFDRFAYAFQAHLAQFKHFELQDEPRPSQRAARVDRVDGKIHAVFAPMMRGMRMPDWMSGYGA
jgi:hypothetical protein